MNNELVSRNQWERISLLITQVYYFILLPMFSIVKIFSIFCKQYFNFWGACLISCSVRSVFIQQVKNRQKKSWHFEIIIFINKKIIFFYSNVHFIVCNTSYFSFYLSYFKCTIIFRYKDLTTISG